jgi:ATP-dependent DNA helicase DinG
MTEDRGQISPSSVSNSQSLNLKMGDFFSPEGAIGRAFGSYERRQQQIEMAEAVQWSLSGKRHLVVEAGTGVGKSLAYLVPAIEKACINKSRVVVSTFTISLQEQLINKDIPCLGESLPWQFKAVLAKGRGNYLCKRRLEFARRRQMGLFDSFGEALDEIGRWAGKTADGSLSELPFIPDARVWDAVKAENGNCLGRRCGFFGSCFCQRARRELENANVIVTNHALLFSDLVLREADVSILPDYRWVVIDEAHNMERVAEEHFGIDISNGSVRFLLDGLYNPRTHKGLLVYAEAGKLTNLVVRAGEAAKEFFKNVRQWYERNLENTNGRSHKNFVEDNVSGYFKELRKGLAELAKQTKDEDERFELMRNVDRISGLLEDLAAFLQQTKQDYVYWVEINSPHEISASPISRGKGRRESVRLKSAPLNVGPDVKRCLFDKFESVIMTSATLNSGETGEKRTSNIEHSTPTESGNIERNAGFPAAKSKEATSREQGRQNKEHRMQNVEQKTGNKQGFEFFAGRIGLQDFEALKLGSPFDYQKQVTIYIESELPEPNNERFVERATEAAKKYVLQTQGRAFVLFTSYKMLDDFATQMKEWFGENNIELLQQGVGFDRSSLLKKFKRQGPIDSAQGRRYVLFGTDSFWQGVDVAGEALSNVIIVRLPFAVPDTPLLAGRLDKIREEGGNPFLEYQLPLAIIKFKQGFGRLIRTKTDTGIIVILDSRILSKSYGRNFLSAIPKCKTEIAARSK